MTLNDTAPATRARLVAQLYDDWRGCYVLRQLIGGAWQDVRELSRDEALTYRCATDEALELRWPASQ